MDPLNFKPKNVLPEEIVDLLAGYWCDTNDTRDENLGQFIQRVAEIGQWWPLNKGKCNVCACGETTFNCEYTCVKCGGDMPDEA